MPQLSTIVMGLLIALGAYELIGFKIYRPKPILAVVVDQVEAWANTPPTDLADWKDWCTNPRRKNGKINTNANGDPVSCTFETKR